jgi:hypothetical protein
MAKNSVSVRQRAVIDEKINDTPAAEFWKELGAQRESCK